MKKTILFLFGFLSFALSAQTKNVFDIARSGSLDEMKMAFKTNPEVINTVNDNGSSTLILACYRGNIEVAKFLIDNVKDIDYNTGMGTALMGAIFKDQIELIKLLLNKKANVDAQDANGGTALMLAVQGANQEIIKLLLERKANKAIKNNDGKTAFEIAVFAGNEAIINLLK